MTDVDREILLRALDASSERRQLRHPVVNSSGGGGGIGSNFTSAVAVNLTTLLVGNGSANATASPAPEADAELRFWVLVLLLFPCFTIFGNVLVVLAVYRERSLQSVTNYFIVSLAFADILVGAIVMPISVYVEVMNGVWLFPNIFCDLWIMCDALFSTASILNLVAISIDRFIAVTQPIKYSKHKNSKRTQFTIAATWLLSIAIALPIGCGLQNLNGIRKRPEFKNMCTFYHGDFLIYSSLGSFYIPCIVMIVLYYRIFKVIWQRAKKAAAAKRGKVYANQKATGRAAAAALAPPPPPVKKATLLVRANPNRPNNLSVTLAPGNDHRGGRHSGRQSPADPDAEDDDFTLSTNNSMPLNESMTFAGPSTSDNSGGPSDACETRLDEDGRPSARGPASAQAKKLFRMKMKRKSAGTKTDRSAARLEKKATKTLAIVLGVFLLCWLPFFISNLIWAACLKNIDSPVFNGPMCNYDRRISVFIVWLGYVNSTLNPLIYTIFNNEFRKAFKKLLHIA